MYKTYLVNLLYILYYMSNCYNNEKYNPMGNFLPFDDRNRQKACDITNNSNIFYTNPVTTSYPDTTGFAKFLFPDPGRCRETGYLCKTNADSTLNLDRKMYLYDDKNYMTINNNTNNNDISRNINNVFR